jgi:hypothetical protein
MKTYFVHFCLAMIVVLLALIAYRQSPHIAYGAAPQEYKVVYYQSSLGHTSQGQSIPNPVDAQTMLNQNAKDGWELVTALGTSATAHYIFKK